MKEIKAFKSAADFRRSLEQRLLTLSQQNQSLLTRLRRQVAFERFVARLIANPEHAWILKGGFAMELRFINARATKDIDLVMANYKSFLKLSSIKEGLLEALKEACEISLNDYFEFKIDPSKQHLEGPIYGGERFPVTSFIADKKFVNFNIDVVLGEEVLAPIEEHRSLGWFSPYGFAPITYKMISKEQQFAEKLHAYTWPRSNSRVKDLIDLVLLLEHGNLNPEILQRVIVHVFKKRNTHSYPDILQPPPEDWHEKFTELATDSNLRLSLDEAFDKLQHWFIQHVIQA